MVVGLVGKHKGLWQDMGETGKENILKKCYKTESFHFSGRKGEKIDFSEKVWYDEFVSYFYICRTLP